MTHLSHDQLVAWRDRPTDAQRADVVPHLAVCATCAATYAELVRTAPAIAPAPPLDAADADWVARGIEVGPRRKAKPWIRRPWVLSLAAAAGIIVAVVVIQRESPPDTTGFRGSARVAAIAPVGEVASVTVFTWEGTAEASFRFELMGAGGEMVHEARVRGVRYTLPDAIRDNLTRGVEYQWTITELDARGAAVESSAPARFTWRR